MGKFGTLNLGKSVNSYTDGEEVIGYSKVVIDVSDDISYEAGDDSGRTLTLENPWGTQQMADDLLAKVKNARYKPYEASGAVTDPAMELGDFLNVNGNSARAYALKTNFGGMPTADISAPGVEEMDEETPYKSTTERKITRQGKQLRAEFQIVAGEIRATVEDIQDSQTKMESSIVQNATAISAKVSKTGGDSKSFGWVHDDEKIVYSANNSEVFRIDKNGAKVTGEIRATSGTIGGFTIESNYLSYSGQTWGGDKTSGIYLGAKGFQMGQNLQITMEGDVYAKNGKFSGTVNAGKIAYGGSDSGYFNGAGITGSTISTAKLNPGVNASLGYANYANDALVNGSEKILAGAECLYLDGYRLVKNYNSGLDINYISWVKAISAG